LHNKFKIADQYDAAKNYCSNEKQNRLFIFLQYNAELTGAATFPRPV